MNEDYFSLVKQLFESSKKNDFSLTNEYSDKVFGHIEEGIRLFMKKMETDKITVASVKTYDINYKLGKIKVLSANVVSTKDEIDSRFQVSNPYNTKRIRYWIKIPHFENGLRQKYDRTVWTDPSKIEAINLNPNLLYAIFTFNVKEAVMLISNMRNEVRKLNRLEQELVAFDLGFTNDENNIDASLRKELTDKVASDLFQKVFSN